MASRLLVASAVPLTANYYGVNKRLDHVDQSRLYSELILGRNGGRRSTPLASKRNACILLLTFERRPDV